MTGPGYMDSTLFRAAWAPGTVARYLTIGGSTVDLTYIADDPERTAAHCTGCKETQRFEWNPEEWNHDTRLYERKGANPDRANGQARAWAQAHAEKCRAMSRPATT